MKITPIFSGDIPLMAIGYKQNSHKVLVFITTEGSGSTDPVDIYLSRFPDNYYLVYIIPVVHPLILGRYLHYFKFDI